MSKLRSYSALVAVGVFGLVACSGEDDGSNGKGSGLGATDGGAAGSVGNLGVGGRAGAAGAASKAGGGGIAGQIAAGGKAGTGLGGSAAGVAGGAGKAALAGAGKAPAPLPELVARPGQRGPPGQAQGAIRASLARAAWRGRASAGSRAPGALLASVGQRARQVLPVPASVGKRAREVLPVLVAKRV